MHDMTLPGSSQPAQPFRALVVDDNRDLADNVAELLRSDGCEVVVAYGVHDANRALTTGGCELAIVDIRMAEGGGLAVLASVKEKCPDAEVILMTANASVDTAIHAVAEGAFAYLEKPFDPQQLLNLCERALTQTGLRRDRLELQRDLARSETLYREVVDNVEALILSVDRDGVIRMCNEFAANTLGYGRYELTGMNSTRLLPSPAAHEAFADGLRAAWQGTRTTDLELPLITHSGEERIVRFTLSQMDLGDEHQAMTLAVGMDMTDRLELERRASEAQAMASIATLTAGLAHEVRNPLNAASLQLQLLQRQVSKLADANLIDKMGHRITIVSEELVRLTKLLDDFLKLARPQRLALSPVDLIALVDEVRTMYAPSAVERGIVLDSAVEHGSVVAQGDQGMLKQVMVNLVVNALDAIDQDGKVILRCFGQGRSRVALEVQDTGPGIPEDVRASLFTPFVTTKEAGTGLGLTIVKRIIDRHGGTVTVSSPAVGGTLFRITLQRNMRASEPPVEPSSLATGSSSVH